MRDREQARERFVSVLLTPFPGWIITKGNAPRVADELLDAYEALPIVVTDEMVERAWGAMARRENLSQRSMGVGLESMRVALEAALKP